jgi:hypothetical protein
VPGCASSKKVARSAPEIIFTLFRFHCGISYLLTITASVACDDVAVAGFWSASFEGGRKSGEERGGC